jgi:prepilin-type N-terminal cleavage/methylation domain-containing protein
MKSMQYLSKTKLGFTLVELMVVLGIIGLLVGLATPAIIAAQRGSRNTNRLKQVEAIRNGMADYFSQYNDSAINVYPVTGNLQQVNVGISATDKRAINVQSSDSYNYNILSTTTCTASTGKDIYLYVDTAAGDVVMCKEGGGVQTLNYKK